MLYFIQFGLIVLNHWIEINMRKIAEFFKSLNPKYWVYDFVKFTWIPVLYLLHPPKILYCNAEKKKPNIKGRALLVSNHTWWMDPITLILAFWRRRLYTLAAVEVLGPGRFARWIRNRLLFVDVDRSKLDIRSFSRCVDLLQKERCLLIFPEGRFVFEDEIQPFKGGTVLMAVQTSSPIYPIYIHGYYKAFHPIYMAIGEPIDAKELIDGIPDSEKIQKLNDYLRECVQELRIKLEETLPEKEIDTLNEFKKAKREALAKKAEERAKAWREAQEKGKV